MRLVGIFIVRLISMCLIMIGGWYSGMLLVSFIMWAPPNFEVPASAIRFGSLWALIASVYLTWRKK